LLSGRENSAQTVVVSLKNTYLLERE
jgi:hypothetical protein